MIVRKFIVGGIVRKASLRKRSTAQLGGHGIFRALDILVPVTEA